MHTEQLYFYHLEPLETINASRFSEKLKGCIYLSYLPASQPLESYNLKLLLSEMKSTRKRQVDASNVLNSLNSYSPLLG